jgi:hypothetical protein
MKRTHGLVPLAILHHVTAAFALLAMLGHCLSPSDQTNFQGVLQVCAFAFLTVIVRRGWASIDGGSIGMSPGKAQGFLWIPCFNFYWVFPAFVSLATQTNAKADAENIPEGKITRGFGLVIAILFSVTTLTTVAASQHPLLAWVNFVIYATYVGFTVTYIWQIKASAEAFDAKAAPALREPTKLPTVGIAGIIYGPMVATALAIAFLANSPINPDTIKDELGRKGYTVEIENQSFAMLGISKKDQDVLGISRLQKITVRDNAGRRIGTVQVMQCNKPASEVKKAFEGTSDTESYFSGEHIFTEPQKNGVTMPFSDWLKSF